MKDFSEIKKKFGNGNTLIKNQTSRQENLDKIRNGQLKILEMLGTGSPG